MKAGTCAQEIVMHKGEVKGLKSIAVMYSAADKQEGVVLTIW